jgi:hypothetical protein
MLTAKPPLPDSHHKLDNNQNITGMTKRELNRDCRRLIRSYKENGPQRFDTKEFKRIYYADRNFEYLTKNNALGLMRINLALRVIPLHNFGIDYEI